VKIYKCGWCTNEGLKHNNGFSAGWCGFCGRNNKLTLVDPVPMTVNGNEHLANMEVLEYDGLKFVTESPRDGSVRLTIYRGEETTPLSTAVYGNEDPFRGQKPI
jgi:hypothetical protein